MTGKEFRAQVFEANKAANNGRAYCVLCGKDVQKPLSSLVADHINNNNKDHRLENGQVLCRQHNYSKNPPKFYNLKGESLNSVSVRGWRSLTEKLPASTAEYAKGEDAKPKFLKWLYSEMLKYGELVLEDAVYSGSKVCGVGPDTVRSRYLKPEYSRVGDIAKVNKSVEMEPGNTVKVDVLQWKPGARERFIKSQFYHELKKYVE